MGLFAPRPKKATRQPLPQRVSKQTPLQRRVTFIYLGIVSAIGLWVILLSVGRLTIAGIPAPIIINFLQDKTARTAYFEGDKQALHDRLEAMGVEAQIKDFYRSRIPDNVELDQYIHQLLYERTGYVGKAYRVNSEGTLVLREELSVDAPLEVQLP